MKITIRNKINIDNQIERIKEIFSGEIKQISGKTVLIYQNANDEKVMIKFTDEEMNMIRYADRAVSMRFNEKIETSTSYEGLGELIITTDSYKVNHELKNLKISYQLAQNDQKIGDYKLRIDWHEDN
jgi:uncharacterized beta-barrel protein YwiB (DUF1934 family)